MMNKKLIALAMAALFTAASVVTVYAFTCKVKSVDGATVVLDCKDKDAKKLEVGGKAKLKPKIEGC